MDSGLGGGVGVTGLGVMAHGDRGHQVRGVILNCRSASHLASAKRDLLAFFRCKPLFSSASLPGGLKLCLGVSD